MAHPAVDSVPLLERALRYEGSLRSRTEGLTWMLWGLVFGAILVTYAGTGGAFAVPGAWPLLALLWVPWVLVGSLFTWALWRSAALVAPLPAARPAGGWVTAGWLVVVFLAVGAAFSLPLPRNEESAPVVGVGLAWLAMGALNLVRATPEGRRTVLGIGAATTLLGLALLLALPAPDYGAPSADLVVLLHDLARAAVVMAVPLAGGLRQALRG